MEKLGRVWRDRANRAPQLISSQQLARGLVLPVRSVYQLARDGRIPGVIRIGRRVRFDAAVVEEWLRTKPRVHPSASAARSS